MLKQKITGENPEVRSDKRKSREDRQTVSHRHSQTLTDSHIQSQTVTYGQILSQTASKQTNKQTTNQQKAN